MKRRELVKRLLEAGYSPDGGTNHEHYKKDKVTVMVPRHREIPDQMARAILKQAAFDNRLYGSRRKIADMLVINEFEFFEDDGMVCALPFDREGATCGEDLEDAVAMAADWLYETVKYEAIDKIDPPNITLGHEPQHGGQVMAVAVDFDINHVDAVTAADAARMLGLSTARIAQMCDKGQLTSWKDGSKRLILRDSVNARLEEAPKAGRPKKKASA